MGDDSVGLCSGVLRQIEDFFFQAEDGIRDVERSRRLGDVYKRQVQNWWNIREKEFDFLLHIRLIPFR